VIKKRLVGVITVKQGWAVQSMGYRRHLPMGRPEVVAETLDRWGVDEILLQCIDRSRKGLGPDLALLERISRKGLATPLTYQGGIRDVADGVAVVQAGAERIALDSLLRDNPRQAAALAGPLGAQALIAALPVASVDGVLQWLDHRSGQSTTVPPDVAAVLKSGAISEVLIVDWQHEGQANGFDERLLDQWPLPGLPLIAFGGLSEAAQLRRVLGRPAVVAAGVGNFLAWREHAVQHLKSQLLGLPLRPAAYAQPCWR
jgi:cyclase